jgi:DNA-binding transcriptional ArsR family regulator
MFVNVPSELRQAIKALSDDTRLAILNALLRHNELTFNQLMQEVQIGKTSLSHNLSVLSNSGLVESLYGKTTCDSIYCATSFGEELFKNMLNSFEIANSKTKTLPNNPEVTAFLSASFSETADEVIDWFRKVSQSLGVNTVWLKEKYESRPTKDKILSHVDECDALIQIITADAFNGTKEAGWLGNEIAWAYRSKPGNCIAIFIEKGLTASGLARGVADNLEFDRNDLQDVAPKVVSYLLDLKYRVEIKRRKT